MTQVSNLTPLDVSKSGVFIETPAGYLAHAIGISIGGLAEALDIKHDSMVRMTQKLGPTPAGILDDLGRVGADFAKQGLCLSDPTERFRPVVHPMAFARHIWNWKATGMTLQHAVEVVEERLQWEFEMSGEQSVRDAFDEAHYAAAIHLPMPGVMMESPTYSTIDAMVRLAGYSSSTFAKLLQTHRGNARRMMSGELDPSSSEIAMLLEELAISQYRAYTVFWNARDGVPVGSINGETVDGTDIAGAWMIALESSVGRSVRNDIAACYPGFVKLDREAA